jgi:hypothetical protein
MVLIEWSKAENLDKSEDWRINTGQTLTLAGVSPNRYKLPVSSFLIASCGTNWTSRERGSAEYAIEK